MIEAGTAEGLRVPRLMAISAGRGSPTERRLDGWVEALAEARVEALQIREKHLDDRALFALARRAVDVSGGRIAVLVNGRIDIAAAAGADGVHLPRDAVPTAVLRRRFGDALLIGRSTHHLHEVIEAQRAGADYVTFGPVWPTPSKRGYGSPPGLAGLAHAADFGLPVLALGGVSATRLPQVAATGAFGAAAIRMLQSPPSILEASTAAAKTWPPAGARDSLAAIGEGPRP